MSYTPNPDGIFRSIRPPSFKGNKDEWFLWSKKFLSGSKLKCYIKAIDGSYDHLLEKDYEENIKGEDVTEELRKEYQRSQDSNDRDLFDLIVSSEDFFE